MFVGNKLPSIFLKEHLCKGNLSPAHKIFTESPELLNILSQDPWNFLGMVSVRLDLLERCEDKYMETMQRIGLNWIEIIYFQIKNKKVYNQIYHSILHPKYIKVYKTYSLW